MNERASRAPYRQNYRRFVAFLFWGAIFAFLAALPITCAVIVPHGPPGGVVVCSSCVRSNHSIAFERLLHEDGISLSNYTVHRVEFYQPNAPMLSLKVVDPSGIYPTECQAGSGVKKCLTGGVVLDSPGGADLSEYDDYVMRLRKYWWYPIAWFEEHTEHIANEP